MTAVDGRIEAVNGGTGIIGVSNSNGFYSISLTNGTYSLTAKSTGTISGKVT